MTVHKESVGADDPFWKHLDERCRQINRIDETTAEDVRGVDMSLLVIVFVGLPVLIAVLVAIAA